MPFEVITISSLDQKKKKKANYQYKRRRKIFFLHVQFFSPEEERLSLSKRVVLTAFYGVFLPWCVYASFKNLLDVKF